MNQNLFLSLAAVNLKVSRANFNYQWRNSVSSKSLTGMDGNTTWSIERVLQDVNDSIKALEEIKINLEAQIEKEKTI